VIGGASVSSTIKSYRDLIVWQRAMELADMCLDIARHKTRRGSATLLNQMLRAAVSVPANIAEGAGRSSRPDYLRHLSIANGSLKELETHLLLVERAGCECPETVARALTVAAETGRMLTGLTRSLRANEEK
jgi:four helix bundle protein